MTKDLPWFRLVMRKLIATVALALIAGVFPAMASLGFCSTLPCCRSHEGGVVAIGSHSACCNETNCSTATAKPAELGQQTKIARASVHDLPIIVAQLPAIASFAMTA